MADITMCKDTTCPQNERCYRYIALPNDLWQSYFLSSPKKMDGCPEYWPISGDESKEYEDRSRHRNNYESQDDSRSSDQGH